MSYSRPIPDFKHIEVIEYEKSTSLEDCDLEDVPQNSERKEETLYVIRLPSAEKGKKLHLVTKLPIQYQKDMGKTKSSEFVSVEDDQEKSIKEIVFDQTIKRLKAEKDIVENFYLEHQKEYKENKSSFKRSHIPNDRKNQPQSLASLIKGTRRSWYSLYSGDRSYGILRKLGIETRATALTLTPEELAIKAVSSKIAKGY